MNPTPETLSTKTTLAEIATTRAGATRVFNRHGLDFCCRGKVALDVACQASGIATETILTELAAEEARTQDFTRLDGKPLDEVVGHVLERFHAGHREQLPHVIEMARKVETVHADKASCPRGLTRHLEHVASALEEHMQKEEQVLFPLFLQGRGRMASMPVQMMELEHVEHGENLARLRKLAHDYVPPADACTTWRALYVELAQLERDVMEHIHIENNILFPRALRS